MTASSEKAAPILLLPGSKRGRNPDQASFVAALQTPAALFGYELRTFGLSDILQLSVVLVSIGETGPTHSLS
jgi:hypothetical protein